MTNFITKALLFLFATVPLTNLPAATPSLPAAPSKYVTDYAGVLGAGTADRLSSQLATLKADARRTLRSFLPRLVLAERLVTTDVLGQEGDTVPLLRD